MSEMMNGGIKMQETRLSVEQRRETLKSAYPKWEKKAIAAHFEKQCNHYRDYPLIMMP